MPAMTQEQLRLLNAQDGAFSVVTHREATGDKSITLDREEKRVLSLRYSLDSFARRGGYIQPDENGKKEFNVISNSYDTQFYKHEILIVYPKAEGNELRLYMSSGINLTADAGDIFVIYIVSHLPYPVIGFINRARWEQFTNQSDTLFITQNFDLDDSLYQNEVAMNQALPPLERISYVQQRNVTLATRAIQNAGYRCEVNGSHTTFISPVTNAPYMEAHHLIPLGHQNQFSYRLDDIHNIYSLCPNCHRLIHYGKSLDKKYLLGVLYQQREQLINNFGVNFADLCSLYGIGSE